MRPQAREMRRADVGEMLRLLGVWALALFIGFCVAAAAGYLIVWAWGWWSETLRGYL